MAYRKIDLKVISEWEDSIRSVVLLNDKRSLGEFISNEQPRHIDLNRIPIGKKFVFIRHENGDSFYDDICDYDEYMSLVMARLIQYTKEIAQLNDASDAIKV